MRRSSESLAKPAGYRLFRQQPGTTVTYWPDPRGPGHGEMLRGMIIEHMGETVSLVWDNDDEHYETWSSKECRYRVDRGQMRFKPPPKERRVRLPADQLTCKTCGRPRQLKCGCPRIGALKPEEWGGQKVDHALLTSHDDDDMMVISNEGNALSDAKGAVMAKRSVAEVIEEDEVEELEELEEAVEDLPAATTSDNMLSAKEAASKIGTDARTLRKFLRKKQGTIGQGQRWEIDADDIDKLKAEFEVFSKGGSKAEKADKPAKQAAKKGKAAPDAEPEADLDADLDTFEEIDDLDFGDEDE